VCAHDQGSENLEDAAAPSPSDEMMGDP